MSTDTLELIELDEALDFKPECESCVTDEAIYQITHPDDGLHFICEKCGEIAKTNIRIFVSITCNICEPDASVAIPYLPKQFRIEPL
jgi:hypothetical protein